MIRKTGLAIGLGAMLLASAPANADDHRRGHHGRHHEDGDDGVVGFIAGALVVGGIAALLGSKKKTPEPVAVAPEDAPQPAEADPEAASAACVAAVEGEGRRTFAIAQAGELRSVEPEGDGFAIAGDVLLRTSWREAGERRPFRCAVDGEAVREVAIEGLRMLPAVASADE